MGSTSDADSSSCHSRSLAERVASPALSASGPVGPAAETHV